MIDFVYNNEFKLMNEGLIRQWIGDEIEILGFKEGDLMYTFCSDEQLWRMNLEYLNHDTYTDIISFDYTMGKLISGEMYISIDRVKENADEFGVSVEEELARVMIHGILHYSGLKDDTELEGIRMRSAEDKALERLKGMIVE